MTGELLCAVAGIIISLAFSYVPGLRTWHDRQTPEVKRAVMALVLVVVTGTIFALSCYGIIYGVSCDKHGAVGLAEAFIMALIANQATFTIAKIKA